MQHRFRAMGTTMALIGPDAGGFSRTARAVEEIFSDQEQRFSRFRPDSELSRVNAQAGKQVKVSAPFAEVTAMALAAAERTGGLFDPTTLPALIAAGYDTDIDDVRAREADFVRGGPPRRAIPACGRHAEVELDGRSLFLPEGVALDFGGIAKGWTADRAAEHAADEMGWALVNAGGDVRLAGEVPAPGLPVGVEDPIGSGDALSVTLASGALATSSTMKRSWGEGLHHLIDPRTSLPSATGFVQVTAWAETCAQAEVFAKWALLGGTRVMDEVHAVGVRAGGDIVMNLEAA